MIDVPQTNGIVVIFPFSSLPVGISLRTLPSSSQSQIRRAISTRAAIYAPRRMPDNRSLRATWLAQGGVSSLPASAGEGEADAAGGDDGVDGTRRSACVFSVNGRNGDVDFGIGISGSTRQVLQSGNGE